MLWNARIGPTMQDKTERFLLLSILVIITILAASCSLDIRAKQSLILANLSPTVIDVQLSTNKGQTERLSLDGYDSEIVMVSSKTTAIHVEIEGQYFNQSHDYKVEKGHPIWLIPDLETPPRAQIRDTDAPFTSVNHRGYNTIAPENTLSAFRLSKENGFDYVETDVSFTEDSVAVLLHDNTIDRTSNGKGAISSMTFDDVRKFDFGSWKDDAYTGEKIPSFEEFLALCVELELYPYIELKEGNRQQIRNLVDMVEDYGLSDKVTWISFDSTRLQYVKAKTPKARLGYLKSTVDEQSLYTVLELRSKVNEVFLDAKNISQDLMTKFVALGIPVEQWVVDTQEQIEALDAHVTGATSDYAVVGNLL